MKQKKKNIGSRSPHGTHSSIIQHSDIRGLPQESGAAWRERRERGAVRRLPRAANAKLCGPPRIRVNQMPARNNTRVIPERTACTAAMRRPLGQVSTRSRSRQHAVHTTLRAMEGGGARSSSGHLHPLFLLYNCFTSTLQLWLDHHRTPRAGAMTHEGWSPRQMG